MNNIYDDKAFFDAYSRMARSTGGLEAAGEWHQLQPLFPAMEGSRVYADLMLQPGTAKFILKNVSDQQLNISADELTERFIRGDISRSTEGSGLGLSIAKSLTEMQGGVFELYLDGDLFKVDIRFPRIKPM